MSVFLGSPEVNCVVAPPRLIPSAIDKIIDMAVCTLVFSDRLSTHVYLISKGLI